MTKLTKAGARRPKVFIAAYDVSRTSSEGHVAISALERLSPHLRIVLLTRQNNADALRKDLAFRRDNPSVSVIGFDLPKWVSWWKKGGRFYQVYAYLWQLWWPVAVYVRRKPLKYIDVVHVLNFHNDSIPSLAWLLGKPTIWGPVNHNEDVPFWRQARWPTDKILRNRLKSILRKFMWRFDPLLRLTVARMSVIIAAGPWVDKRLRIGSHRNVLRRSQLGCDVLSTANSPVNRVNKNGKHLICAGRLDWFKGLDLAVEALAILPSDHKLTFIGDGPAHHMLKTLAVEKGLEDRVVFRRSIPRKELLSEFTKHDLMLFPSPEVAGLVWIEALSCGTPVVVFDGMTEASFAAEKLPGITIAAVENNREKNIAHYAEAILNALNKQSNRAEIARKVALHYNWDSLAEVFLKTYSKLSSGKNEH